MRPTREPRRRRLRVSVPLWLALALAGCPSAPPPAPDEEALERFRLANEHFEAGRFREAIPHYRFVTETRDQILEAYWRLSWCYEVLGDEPEAIRTLERAHQKDRGDEYSLRHLVRMYTHRGRLDDAVAKCGALLALRPGDPEVKGELERLERLRKERQGSP